MLSSGSETTKCSSSSVIFLLSSGLALSFEHFLERCVALPVLRISVCYRVDDRAQV